MHQQNSSSEEFDALRKAIHRELTGFRRSAELDENCTTPMQARWVIGEEDFEIEVVACYERKRLLDIKVNGQSLIEGTNLGDCLSQWSTRRLAQKTVLLMCKLMAQQNAPRRRRAHALPI